MKLTYSRSRMSRAGDVHRFDILGEITQADLAVIETSMTRFILDLPIPSVNFNSVVIDFSESSLKVHETELQDLISELKTLALSSQAFLFIAQTDIESMHAESKVLDTALLQRIEVLESKLRMIESVRKEISAIEKENLELREKLSKRSLKKPSGVFEKLWGEP